MPQIAQSAMDMQSSYKIAVLARPLALKTDPTPAYRFQNQPGPQPIKPGTQQHQRLLLQRDGPQIPATTPAAALAQQVR